MFQKKAPMQIEWENLRKQEAAFLKSRETKKDSFLNRKLEEKVPPKLQTTLDDAFEKAFGLIFEKGTAVIEKTYRKEELEKTYKINACTEEIRHNRKNLQAFSKKAKSTGRKNLLLSGVSGIGLGVFGVGIPDIPLFTGMLFKSIYEIALSYGYEYESEEEKYYILRLIQGAVSYGEEMTKIDQSVNDFMMENTLPQDYSREQQIHASAAALSKELLYMKFLQGVPFVGVVGGAYDAVYMKRITEYANLKYHRRFLTDKERGRTLNKKA